MNLEEFKKSMETKGKGEQAMTLAVMMIGAAFKQRVDRGIFGDILVETLIFSAQAAKIEIIELMLKHPLSKEELFLVKEIAMAENIKVAKRLQNLNDLLGSLACSTNTAPLQS